jgi:uncharacterized protein (UPF0305 family)
VELAEYRNFLAGLGVSVAPTPSAPEAPAGWRENFWKSLAANPSAGRLLRDILPYCDQFNLANFVMLSVHLNLDARFMHERKKRGKDVKASLLKRIRKNRSQLRAPKIIDPFRHRERELQSDKEIFGRIAEAEPFGTTMALTENFSALLVVFEYLKFRSGLVPRPRDFHSLVSAAYDAWKKPRRSDSDDSDLLIRKIRRYAKKHQRAVPSGPRSAMIIERPLPASR